MNALTELRLIFVRNKLLISVVALTFLMVTFLSAMIAYIFLLTSPELVKTFQTAIGTTRQLVAIPPPYTPDLYRLILLNNIGHFWNPTRVWVWIPVVGAFSLGYELLLNRDSYRRRCVVRECNTWGRIHCCRVSTTWNLRDSSVHLGVRWTDALACGFDESHLHKIERPES